MGPFSWRSDARPTWPSWRSIWPIEVLLAALVIVTVGAVIISQAPLLLFKARFTEVLQAMTREKTFVIEEIALRGRAPESDAGEQAGGAVAQATATSDIESRLSGRAFVLAPGFSAANGDVQPRQRLRTGIVDGSVVGVGRLGGYGKSFQIAQRPVWAAGDTGATINWICGERTNLPRDYRPHVCRGEQQ